MALGKLVWRTSSDYIRESSIAGLSHAAKSRNFLQWAYWMVIFTVGFGLTVRSIIDIIADFYTHPVSTISDLRHENSVTFPAITVCNLNRINCLNLMITTEQLRQDETPLNTQDLENLDKLFDITGCRRQVCSYLSSQVPAIRNTSTYDSQVMIMAYLQCGPKTGVRKDFEKNCYYLKQMIHFDPNLSYDDIFTADHLWNTTQCTVPDACKHYQRPLQALDFAQKQFVSGKEIEVECIKNGLLDIVGEHVPNIPGTGGLGIPGLGGGTTSTFTSTTPKSTTQTTVPGKNFEGNCILITCIKSVSSTS